MGEKEQEKRDGKEAERLIKSTREKGEESGVRIRKRKREAEK